MGTEELSFGRLARAKGVDPSTPFRWARKGVVVHGRRIYLRAVRRGGRWFTTEAWLEEFERACTAAAAGEQPPAQSRPRSAAILDAGGIQ